MASEAYFKLSRLEKARSMSVENFGARIRGKRTAETVRKLAETTAVGLLLDGNFPVLSTKDGKKIAEALIVAGEQAIINAGGTAVNTTPVAGQSSPWLKDTDDLGYILVRNLIAHGIVGGHTKGGKNGLSLRGYADDQSDRDIDLFGGVHISYNAITNNAVFRFDTGAYTTSTVQPAGTTTDSTNYDVGQTMRMLITGVGTTGDNNLSSRCVTWELRTDTDPNVDASWTAKMMLCV